MALPTRWRTEFRINGTLTASQYDSVLIGMNDGRSMSFFTDLSSGNTNVRARLLDGAGSATAADFVVNDVLTFNEDSPAAAKTSNGSVLCAWTDDGGALGDPSVSAIHAQLFSASGAALGVELLVNTTSPGAQLDPAVAGLAGDRFLVAWNDQAGGSIRAQIVDAAGQKSGGEFRVSTATGALQAEPVIAALGNGGAFVAWSELNAGASSLDTSGTGILGQILSSNGARSGAAFLINSDTGGYQSAPKAATLSDGRVAVVWTDAGVKPGDSDGSAIRARVFEATGVPVDVEFLVNIATAGDQSEPAIAALADGRFAVAWTDASATGGDTSGQAVRARMFSNSGAPDSAEFLVNLTTAGRQSEPSITVLADGRLLIGWTDESAAFGDASGSAIVGQIFDPRLSALTLVGTT